MYKVLCVFEYVNTVSFKVLFQIKCSGGAKVLKHFSEQKTEGNTLK